MPRWITAIFVFFLSITLLTAKARTATDIIDRFQHEALAGNAPDVLHSIQMRGRFFATDGKRFQINIRQTSNGYFKRDITDGKEQQVIAHDKTGDWISRTTPMMKIESSINNIAGQEIYPGSLLFSSSQKSLTEFTGIENVNGGFCYRLHLLLRPDLSLDYFIDVKNNLLVRKQFTGKNGKLVTIDFSAYHKLRNGICLPFIITSSEEGSVHLQKIVINAMMDTTPGAFSTSCIKFPNK
jgi:hypothetical protein